MATAELTAEQAQAVQAFGTACATMFEAMGMLEREGVDIRTALEHLPGEEDGRSLYDELPSAYKMLV